MLGPLQHFSGPMDPVRQQIAPPQPTLPPQPVTPPSLQPLPPSDSGKDQFSRHQEEQSEDVAEREARRQQQRQEALRAYNSAWARLYALQQIAHSALGEGNGPQAREAAVEAAAVAVSIRELANDLPGVSAGAIDVPAALQSARSGVAVAKDVVDLAITYPAHPVEDRIVLNGARHQVIEAMAGVEAVAVELMAPGGVSALPAHFDVKT
jgi:hypothetical protein